MMMMASMLLLVSIVKKTSRECQWRRSCNKLFGSSFNDSAQDDTDDDSKGDNYDEDAEGEAAVFPAITSDIMFEDEDNGDW